MVESLASMLGSWTLAPVQDVLLESISNLAEKVRKDKCFVANGRDRPDSTGLSGSASILSRYPCHFNTLISPCHVGVVTRRADIVCVHDFGGGSLIASLLVWGATPETACDWGVTRP